MSIISLRTNFPGKNYIDIRLCELKSTDALATVTAAGYVNPYIKMQSIALYPSDIVQVSASDGNQFYKPVFSASGTITLTALP
jgi:hypothetical protein